MPAAQVFLITMGPSRMLTILYRVLRRQRNVHVACDMTKSALKKLLSSQLTGEAHT